MVSVFFSLAGWASMLFLSFDVLRRLVMFLFVHLGACLDLIVLSLFLVIKFLAKKMVSVSMLGISGFCSIVLLLDKFQYLSS